MLTEDFDSYFAQQYPKLVAELDFILGDTDLARDIAQDAFVTQYVSWARLRRYDKPGAWVRRVALRLAFKTRRRLLRLTSYEDAKLDNDPAYATELSSDQVLDIRNAIGQLSRMQNATVVLHYYSDLPVAEVARALDVKESTVKVHLFKARERLATLLADYRPE